MGAPPVTAVRLRDYQEDATRRLRAAWCAGARRLLLVAPTGAGKTTCGADIITKATAKGSRVLALAHRTELIDQLSERLALFGVPHGIIKAGRKPTPGALVQVASVASMARREIDEPTIILVDEAHRTLSPSYLAIILDRFPGAVVIGLTATPIRLDGRGLGDVYDTLIEATTIGELVARGLLHRPRVLAPSVPDLKGLRSSGGDYSGLQLAERMNKPQLVGDIVSTWREHAEGSRTVVFAASTDHSRAIRDAFLAAGYAAEHLDGETPETERAAILARVASGATRIVTNFGILTEGWDCPAVSTCVLARPTQSLGLYLQMVGRILRTDEPSGKTGALVLDHAAATFMHGFATSPRTWALDATRKAADASPSIRRCMACFAVCEAFEPACPECGAAWPGPVPKSASSIRTKEGRLVEPTEEQVAARATKAKTARQWREAFPAFYGNTPPDTLADRVALLQALTTEADLRGYKPTWPGWMFNEVTGRWPDKTTRAAVEPAAATT